MSRKIAYEALEVLHPPSANMVGTFDTLSEAEEYVGDDTDLVIVHSVTYDDGTWHYCRVSQPEGVPA